MQTRINTNFITDADYVAVRRRRSERLARVEFLSFHSPPVLFLSLARPLRTFDKLVCVCERDPVWRVLYSILRKRGRKSGKNGRSPALPIGCGARQPSHLNTTLMPGGCDRPSTRSNRLLHRYFQLVRLFDTSNCVCSIDDRKNCWWKLHYFPLRLIAPELFICSPSSLLSEIYCSNRTSPICDRPNTAHSRVGQKFVLPRKPDDKSTERTVSIHQAIYNTYCPIIAKDK